MKGKNKPDNLEDFFKPLGEYEEDPGIDFWERIAPMVPPKMSPVDKGWMLAIAFVAGLLLSSLFFYWQSNTKFLKNLETQIIEKNKQIAILQQQVIELQKQQKENKNKDNNPIVDIDSNNEEITQQKSALSLRIIDSPEKVNLRTEPIQTDQESIIKLEIARKTALVTAASNMDGGWLQRFLHSVNQDFLKLFKDNNKSINIVKLQQLLTDKQLISNTFFEGLSKDYAAPSKSKKVTKQSKNLNLLPVKKTTSIAFDKNNFAFSLAEKTQLLGKAITPKLELEADYEKLTAFITGSINPLSSYKYDLVGYEPAGSINFGSAGVGTSWNWSLYDGEWDNGLKHPSGEMHPHLLNDLFA